MTIPACPTVVPGLAVPGDGTSVLLIVGTDGSVVDPTETVEVGVVDFLVGMDGIVVSTVVDISVIS